MLYLRLVSFAAILMVLGTEPAHAYLDPGTGSMLLQGLIGSAVAAGSIISLYWHRLKAFFTGTKAIDDGDDDDK